MAKKKSVERPLKDLVGNLVDEAKKAEKQPPPEDDWQKRRDARDKEEINWLPSDIELWGKIQAIVHAADKYRDLVEARPFECDHCESGADSMLVAGVNLWTLTRILNPAIDGLSDRAHKAARDVAYSCVDDFDNARNAAELTGFNIGIIFGARLAGYSTEQMDKLAKGLFKATIAQPLYDRRGQ